MLHGDRMPVTPLRRQATSEAQAANSLDDFARRKLTELERAHLRRRVVETSRTESIWMVRHGRRLLSFSCNDYLNLAQHPAIAAAPIPAIHRHPLRPRASPLVTATHP